MNIFTGDMSLVGPAPREARVRPRVQGEVPAVHAPPPRAGRASPAGRRCTAGAGTRASPSASSTTSTTSRTGASRSTCRSSGGRRRGASGTRTPTESGPAWRGAAGSRRRSISPGGGSFPCRSPRRRASRRGRPRRPTSRTFRGGRCSRRGRPSRPSAGRARSRPCRSRRGGRPGQRLELGDGVSLVGLEVETSRRGASASGRLPCSCRPATSPGEPVDRDARLVVLQPQRSALRHPDLVLHEGPRSAVAAEA